MWITSLVALWALAVAVFDWKQRRVPNAVLLLLAVPAVFYEALFRHGLLGVGIGQSLFGCAIGGIVLLPGGYLSRQVAAGDVKYAMVQGFVLGVAAILEALVAAGLAIGVLAVVVRVLKIDRQPGKFQSIGLPAAVPLTVGFIWALGHLYVLPAWDKP